MAGGQDGQLPTQFLADQLTLSQPGGHIMPNALLRAHPVFGSHLRPWYKQEMVEDQLFGRGGSNDKRSFIEDCFAYDGAENRGSRRYLRLYRPTKYIFSNPGIKYKK